ncbi:glutamyl-tRNA reductase [Candidatus Marinamargulisbacteria bacterium SCGC AG-414-C22]|nr:glutamyl-tRNA reductase [Candidatus Marinamargulisbacteria bacterium SCGC AG-414-C22]
MNLGLVGIDHTKSQIQAFESIFLGKEEKNVFYTKIVDEAPVTELVILTTCNRIEFYFVAPDIQAGGQWIIETLAVQKNCDLALVQSLLSIYDTTETQQHLFEVACGVQSMVFGENEILTQVKNAYEHAYSKHKTGALLNKFFQTAIATGKRARTETQISRGAYSVSSIAIDAIRKKLFDYFEKSILIIGMGTMGSRCLKKLDALGHQNVTITNRTHERSLHLASQCNAIIEHYDDIYHKLHEYDIVISALSVKSKTIIPVHFKKAINKTLIIDLGLPRNVDPRVENNDLISLINVDGLKIVASENVHKRKAELEKVMVIVDSEIANLNNWKKHRQQWQKQ